MVTYIMYKLHEYATNVPRVNKVDATKMQSSLSCKSQMGIYEYTILY